jgi:endo-1,4-beta-xylanase
MLTATLLAALVPLVAATPVARQDGVNVEALRTLAQAQDKYFGTAYQSFYLADERFEPILDGEFNQYTPENEMKWEVIQAERGVFNWTGADLVRLVAVMPLSYPRLTVRSSNKLPRPARSSGDIISSGTPSSRHGSRTSPMPESSRMS